MTGLCECGCGQRTSIPAKSCARRGIVKGKPRRFVHGHNCRNNFLKHGCALHGRETPEYRIYQGAKARCTNPRNPGYPYYGGRGIRFEFKSFQDFIAAIGRRPNSELSLDRINNDGPYAPGNLRWATREEQRANRRDSHV